MSLTESTMLELNSLAPEFSLPSTEGQVVSLDHFKDNPFLVVLFICNHCPYVIHIAPALAAMAGKYQQQGVGFVAINSNDTDAYPADSFELMKVEKDKQGYPFPYLFDADQSVAKAYSAACTPDIFVFNASRQLVYRGQFDDSRPSRIASGNYNSTQDPASGNSLASALDTLIAGQALTGTQYPSIGCNIKWKPGKAS